MEDIKGTGVPVNFLKIQCRTTVIESAKVISKAALLTKLLENV